MFLPMFTIGELVNPFHLETVGNLIFANDIGFVAGWIIYRISTVLDYLKKNPMVDLNDHHEGGLAMISECEYLLREREEP